MIKYLLGKASTGKFRYAIVECDEEWHEPEHGYIIQRSYGQVQGKNTLSPAIVVDKTKQKRNWVEQYTLQFNSEVKKFLDKGYVEVEKHPNEYSEEELNDIFGDVKTNQFGVIKPMLAKQSEKVTNQKIFDKEWLASRKLDGVRCLMYYKDGEIHTASRGGEHYDYSTEHLRTDKRLIEFFEANPTIILDGELFKRFKSLQQISGAARMEKSIYDCDWLEYWIYDMYYSDMSALDRYKFLLKNLNTIQLYTGTDCDDEYDSIRLLEQVIVKSWKTMEEYHDKYVSDGFEGLVIRDPNKSYKPGGRTNDMIKIKKYKSSEFLVTGYELGLRGSEDMTFICETKDGIVFKAMPVGDRDVKAKYVENFEEKYKGHIAECTYFNLSDDGVPTQPKLRIFRFDLE
jgi:ATP-dependent DNA ligase